MGPLLSASLVLLLQAQAGLYGEVLVSYPDAAEYETGWRHPLGASPAYPEQLAMQGIVGCAVYQIHVDSQGRTAGINFVAAVPPEVDQASRRILQSWHWEAGEQNTSAGSVSVRLDYCIGAGSAEAAQKACQIQTEMVCR